MLYFLITSVLEMRNSETPWGRGCGLIVRSLTWRPQVKPQSFAQSPIPSLSTGRFLGVKITVNRYNYQWKNSCRGWRGGSGVRALAAFAEHPSTQMVSHNWLSLQIQGTWLYLLATIGTAFIHNQILKSLFLKKELIHRNIWKWAIPCGSCSNPRIWEDKQKDCFEVEARQSYIARPYVK